MKTVSYDENIWRLAPIDATIQMIDAPDSLVGLCGYCGNQCVIGHYECREAYSAMLAAAPQPPEVAEPVAPALQESIIGKEISVAQVAEAPCGMEAQRDAERLNFLQNEIVDTFYLDDGRIIDVQGNDLRAAIDAAIAAKKAGM